MRSRLDNIAYGIREMSSETISIIIPTRDRPALLRQVLAALRAEGPEAAEIIVVDDGSRDRVILPDHPTVQVHRNERSLGSSAARNLGARVATGDVLAFLDDDILVTSESWRLLLEHFAKSEEIWVGPLVVERTEHLSAGMDQVRSAPHLPAALLLTRRASFVATGGFDERLARMVDFDITTRAKRLGHSLLYDMRAPVLHLDTVHTFRQKVQRMHDWLCLFPLIWSRQGRPDDILEATGRELYSPSLLPPNRPLRALVTMLAAEPAWKAFLRLVPHTTPGAFAERKLMAIAATRGAWAGLRSLPTSEQAELLARCSSFSAVARRDHRSG